MVRTFINIAFVLALWCNTSLAQNSHPILRDFFGRQEGNTIVLTWIIKGGNTCQGTRIQRFENDSAFVQIGEYDGICGDASSDEKYEFTDNAPLPNQTNFYRLELGHQGYTNVIQADFYTYTEGGYIILGNPLVEVTTIVFDNPKGEEYELSLYDINGRIVLQKPTEKTKVKIYNEGFMNGLYTFVISNEEQAILKGKLLVTTN